MPRILVVDDEPDILDSLAPTLEQALGVDVVTATSAEEAQRRIVENGRYAMVITDQRMPGLKGTELLAWLRRERPESVRVLMSAFYDSFIGPDAKDCEPHLFLRKPFRVDTMVAALREALRGAGDRAEDDPPSGMPPA